MHIPSLFLACKLTNLTLKFSGVTCRLCHQLTQNTTIDRVRFTIIVLKFKTQVLQVCISEIYV